jgi:hypothetical protein
VLDLVQFLDPPTQGQPYSSLNNVGICRIAFTVKDIEKAYADLQKMDVSNSRSDEERVNFQALRP